MQVEGDIWHVIYPDDQAMLAHLAVNAEVTVRIDVERRASLSLSHTASHLLYPRGCIGRTPSRARSTAISRRTAYASISACRNVLPPNRSP